MTSLRTIFYSNSYWRPEAQVEVDLPSITVTVKVPTASFPEGSEKMYSTMVCPTGKKSPGSAERLTSVTKPESSMAMGSVKNTLRPGMPSST